MRRTQTWPCQLGCPPQPVQADNGCLDKQSGSTPAGLGTEGGRRWPKTAFTGRSVSGAVLQREMVEPSPVVPAGVLEHSIVHNACTNSCASGHSYPTHNGVRRKTLTWKRKVPNPREGPPSRDTRRRDVFKPYAPREGPPSTEHARQNRYIHTASLGSAPHGDKRQVCSIASGAPGLNGDIGTTVMSIAL